MNIKRQTTSIQSSIKRKQKIRIISADEKPLQIPTLKAEENFNKNISLKYPYTNILRYEKDSQMINFKTQNKMCERKMQNEGSLNSGNKFKKKTRLHEW